MYGEYNFGFSCMIFLKPFFVLRASFPFVEDGGGQSCQLEEFFGPEGPIKNLPDFDLVKILEYAHEPSASLVNHRFRRLNDLVSAERLLAEAQGELVLLGIACPHHFAAAKEGGLFLNVVSAKISLLRPYIPSNCSRRELIDSPEQFKDFMRRITSAVQEKNAKARQGSPREIVYKSWAAKFL
jgi:hypothetical protein